MQLHETAVLCLNKSTVLVLITELMREIVRLIFVLLLTLCALTGHTQTTVPLPGRNLVKLTPDYLRPVVYALNAANGSSAGTLLALNATNGAVVNEIGVGINPTDMALTPAAD